MFKYLLIPMVLGSLMPLSAQAASFNCNTADRPDEVLICPSRELSGLDERMSGLYYTLRNRLGGAQRRELEADQHSWLRRRIACGADLRCINLAYTQRIQQLKATESKFTAQELIRIERTNDGHSAVTLGVPLSDEGVSCWPRSVSVIQRVFSVRVATHPKTALSTPTGLPSPSITSR